MRVVVSKRVAGLGSCLVSLFRAWYYAQRTDRHLIIDWRNSTYLPDSALNLFNVLFENRTTIADVPVVTGDAVSTFLFEEPFFPNGWNRHNVHKYPTAYFHSDDLDAAYPEIRFRRLEQYELCTRGKDLSAPTIVFHHGLRDGGTKERYSPDIPCARIAQTFVNGLNASASVVSLVNEFAEVNFHQRPVIGLHIRHGNGEYSQWRDRLNTKPRILINKCISALEVFRQQVGEPKTLFLCTDSIDVHNCFTQRIPSTVTFPKTLLARGAGPLHMGFRDSESAITALAEMMLLSRCDAIIHTESQFTFYPLFKTSFIWSASLSDIKPAHRACRRIV